MSALDWLKNAGERYLRRIQTEDLVFLVELEIGSDETSELLDQLGRSRDLPWESWAHACVAVAAVQVAYEAPGEERGFTRLFMRRLNQPYSQPVWEEQYGKRIEVLIHKYFPDDFRGYGAFRYVGPLYRHSGIPAIALLRFAQFLRHLISAHGPAFTRQEFELARRHVSGIASRFLGSEYGFQYARDAARILNSIDIGLIPPAELASIPGYRRDFWAEIIAAVGTSQQLPAPRTRKAYDDPVLALAADEGQLVVRFDPAAIRANVVRLGGRPVLYAEVPTSSDTAPRIEIENRQFRFERWWSPVHSLAALFRGSDGNFVASEGGVPGGEYFLVAEQTIEPASELHPEEFGYLAESDYRIWHVTLAPEMEVRGCDLYATGSKPAPQIQFAPSRRNSLGPYVFEERLPDLVIRNWDDENASRFWIFIDDGAGPQRLEVEPGSSRLRPTVPCPATGAIWIEARGFFRQASALPRLPFTVLPAGIALEFAPQCTWMDDPAFVSVRTPHGWRVVCSYPKTVSGRWSIPPRERVFEGILDNGGVRVSFSVRVPRIGMYMHPPNRIWWADIVDPNRKLHIEGAPGLSFSICLKDDRGLEEISGDRRIRQNGMLEFGSLDIRDALSLSGAAGGEFVLRLAGQELLNTGWHFASAARIRERIGMFPDSSPVFNLPGIGSLLRSIRDLHQRALITLACGPIKEHEPLRQWLAEFAVCATAFDGTQLTEAVSHWAGAGVIEACEWYKSAVSCAPGKASADLLARRPSDDVLPLDRWRTKFIEQVQRLDSQSDVVGLIASWRDAVRRKDGSATRELLAQRSGGEDLTEGARKYLIGMQSSGTAKMRALNSAIGSFERAREHTSCLIVRAVAAGLLILAYEHSGRTEQITDDLREEPQPLGVLITDFSPWEGDYGPNFTSDRAVASTAATTERR